MSNLLSELEAVVGLADEATPGEWDVFVRRGGMIDVAASHNCTVASTAVPVIGDREANAQLIVRLVNLFRTHHAEIAAAVRDAAYGRALRAAMEAEYQAAKESRKGGRQEAWITTYSLLRRLKVAADHLAVTGIPVTEQDQPLAAMSAREGQG